MNEDRALVLFNAITDIREEYIEEALPREKKRRRPDPRVLAPIAACLCIVIALAFILTHQGAIGLPGGSAGELRLSEFTISCQKSPTER